MFYNLQEFKKIIKAKDFFGKKKYAVIGNPVGHSLSPLLHGIINDECVYYAVILQREELQCFCDIAVKYLNGFNVTVPYKKDIISYLNVVEKEADKLQSVNTVKVQSGGLYGFNTDVYGFEKALVLNGVDIRGKKALVLGAGGSASAAVYALKKGGADVSVAARNTDKARAYIEADIVDIKTVSGSYDLVINCTPCGMKGFENVSALEFDHIKNCTFVFDFVYNPLKTKLMLDAEKVGIKAANGIETLIYQGVASQRLWGNSVCVSERVTSVLKGEIVLQRLVSRGKRGIALCGFMGCGKSSVSKYLSQNYGFNAVDTDELVQKKSGKQIAEIFSCYGEEYFRDIETEVIADLNFSNSIAVVALGGGAVIRSGNVEEIKKNCVLVYIDCSLKKVLSRANDGTRPLLRKSLAEIEELYSERKKLYSHVCDISVDGNVGIGDIGERIISSI